MEAAESAVTAELESQAVLKETQNAFKNAMLEINVITYQDVEFESDKLKRKMYYLKLLIIINYIFHFMY